MLPVITSALGIGEKLLDKFVEDKDLKRKLNHELKKEMIALDQGQIQVNLEQAKHPSLFVAGARPSIMWICALGLGWSFFLQPLLHWILLITGSDYPMPDINTEGLISLTMALLGLSGMRSWEKSKGVARENMKK
mgnify:FL=1